MKHEELHPGRKSQRLQGFDYSSSGVYFITIVTMDRICRFGTIRDGELEQNEVGQMIQAIWDTTISSLPWLESVESIVMPNHLHGVVWIKPKKEVHTERGEHKVRPYGETNIVQVGTKPESIGRFVQQFKSVSTNAYIKGVKEQGWSRFNKKFWHTNFYDRVIRDEEMMISVREYIQTNPMRWHLDRNNLNRTGIMEFEKWHAQRK